MPEALRILQSKFSVTTNSMLPSLNLSICKSKPEISVNDVYNSRTTDADFILFLEIAKEDSGILAMASPCSIGRTPSPGPVLARVQGRFLAEIQQLFASLALKWFDS